MGAFSLFLDGSFSPPSNEKARAAGWAFVCLDAAMGVWGDRFGPVTEDQLASLAIIPVNIWEPSNLQIFLQSPAPLSLSPPSPPH